MGHIKIDSIEGKVADTMSEKDLPQWFIMCIDDWYTRLAKLPSDFERDVAFFTKTGNDVEGLGFWDNVTHMPIHSASCTCGITSPSMYACGMWKKELLEKMGG